MNSSSAPANESIAYGHLLAMSGKLKRSDQINLVRALAGQLGMIAVFPGQLQAGAAAVPSKMAGSAKGKKGPAKQAPSNPLSGSPEKKAFDAAKKAVAKATKDAGGAKLPTTSPLVLALEKAKDNYFRALSSAKGRKTEDANASSDEEAPPSKTAAPPKPAPKAPAKTSPPRR